jgi:hypothetical protein
MTDLHRTLESPLTSGRSVISPTPLAKTLATAVLIVFVYLHVRGFLPDGLVALAALHAAALFAATKRGGTAGWQSFVVFATQGASIAWLMISLNQGLEWPEVENAFFWTTIACTVISTGRHLIRLWAGVRDQ